MGKKILSNFKRYLSLLNTRSEVIVYDTQDLQKFIDIIFEKDYEDSLEYA